MPLKVQLPLPSLGSELYQMRVHTKAKKHFVRKSRVADLYLPATYLLTRTYPYLLTYPYLATYLPVPTYSYTPTRTYLHPISRLLLRDVWQEWIPPIQYSLFLSPFWLSHSWSFGNSNDAQSLIFYCFPMYIYNADRSWKDNITRRKK